MAHKGEHPDEVPEKVKMGGEVSFFLSRVRPALATSHAYVNPVIAVGLGVVLAGEVLVLFGGKRSD